MHVVCFVHTDVCCEEECPGERLLLILSVIVAGFKKIAMLVLMQL